MTDEEIIGLSKHYNMLAREFVGRGGYYSLSIKNPKEHKNWKFFLKLSQICEENNWNPKQYLDVQFDKAKKYWSDNHYPLPSMICSKNAVLFFEKWRKNQDDIQEDNPKYNRNKSRKTYSSAYDQLIDEVMRAAKEVDNHMKRYFSNRGFKNFQLVNDKLRYITENYWLLPATYLYSYSFIRKDPERFISCTTDYKYGYTKKVISDIKHIFPLLSSNKKMRKIVIDSRKEIESQDSYFVPGEFDFFDPKAAEQFFIKSLKNIGYDDQRINSFMSKSQKLIKDKAMNLKNGGHISSTNILTSSNLLELEKLEQLEEMSEGESDD